jgi:hypothetical protein
MKKLGRAFNHVEDLVFFYGSSGAREAMCHLTEIFHDTNSVRMKWDGGLQIYWGRETIDGPFILTGHNGWSRGIKSTTSDELYDFIVNKSGSPRTTAEIMERTAFATTFANLFSIFEQATPANFVGFVYADALYIEQPEVDENDVYNLYPNRKSGYHIKNDSPLGQRIGKSSVLVVGHAYFDKFGLSDDAQLPKDTFDEFNSTELIVLSPFYANQALVMPELTVNFIDNFITEHTAVIDMVLAPMSGVSLFKDYLYRYTNTTAKNHKLSELGATFNDWLLCSKVSKPQQLKINNRLLQHPDALMIMFELVRHIMTLKNCIIDQLVNEPVDIQVSNSEGWVKYSDIDKKFGNVKLVPRHRWLPNEYR